MLSTFGRLIFTPLMILALVFVNSAQARNVLLIWSASENQPWTAALRSALHQELAASAGDYKLFQEYLNSDQLSAKPDPEIWADAMTNKYQHESIDLILSVELSAGKLLGETTDTLLPDTPRFTLLGPPNPNIPGITNTDQPSKQLDAVATLLPDLEELRYISTLPSIKQGVQQEIAKASYSFNIQLLDDQLSYAELAQHLTDLPPKSALVYAVMHQDTAGVKRPPVDVLREIQTLVKAPIFVDFGTLMLPGTLGGHMLDASKVAQQARQLILGDSLRSQQLPLGTLTLDYTALRHWDIPLSRVPEDSNVINTPLPFWLDHKKQLIYATIALLLLVATATALMFALRLRTTRLKLSESKRVQAEAELAQAKRLSKANQIAELATAATNIGTFQYDTSKDQIWVSELSAKLLGLSPDASGVVKDLGQILLPRIHPDDSKAVVTTYPDAKNSRVELTYRLSNNSGEYRWIHSVSEALRESDPAIRVGIIRDITDEKELSTRLFRSQERMTLALDATQIDLFELNLDSGEALLLAGTSGPYNTGDKFPFIEGLCSQALPSHTRQRIEEEVRREQQRAEYSIRSTDGSILIWHQLSTGQIYTRDNNRYITVARTDITPIREQQYAAQRSGRESQLALEATGGGHARIKVATGRIWLSARSQEIWDTGDLPGNTTSLMALAEQHHPEDDIRVRNEFHKLTNGEAVEPISYRIKLRSGDYRWIKAFGAQHQDIHGNREIVAVFYDISEEKALLQELIDSRERQSRLFAIIGHELRTPIATIKMMLEQQKVYELEPFGKQLNQTMQHTLSVLDDLRSVTQPQQRQAQQTPAVVYDLLEQTLGSLQTLLDEKRIRAHFLTDARVQALCLFDRQALRQMITNLLKNAAIHSGASELWLTAEATEHKADRLAVKISVADNGRGIERELIEPLFEAFRRGNTDADGTGLGLHICRTLAQQLGGTLTYETSPQGGAMFVFNALFSLAPEPQINDGADNETTPTEVAPLAGLRILYAEDQKTLQLLTHTLLKKQGAEVVVVNDGVEALELYESQAPFDLVLTDIMMPRMDGNQLTRSLRDRGFDGRIIGLTAATIGLETHALIENGANAALSKPMDIKQLIALVTETAISD